MISTRNFVITTLFVLVFGSAAHSQSAPPLDSKPIAPTGPSLGSLNTIAEIVVTPRISKAVRARGLNAIRVSVRLDMKKGEVLEANIVSGGHPLVNDVVLKAAKGAKFKPILNESMPGRDTGFITFILGKLNRPKRKYGGSSPFLIFPKGVVNCLAKTIPKPAAVRAGKKFIEGKVEVAVFVDVYDGTVMAAKSISGPPELLAASEKAALGAKFRTLTASGSSIKFASGLMVFTLHEDGRVE